MWDISAAGHVKSGATSIQTAIEEMNEEIGITCNEDDLKFIGTFIQRGSDFNLPENQWNDLYILTKRISLEDIKVDNDETIDVKFIDPSILAKKVAARDESIVPHWDLYEALFKEILI